MTDPAPTADPTDPAKTTVYVEWETTTTRGAFIDVPDGMTVADVRGQLDDARITRWDADQRHITMGTRRVVTQFHEVRPA